MPCTRPLNGFRHRHVNPATGLRSITFSRSEALHPVEDVTLPCGQCSFCRLSNSRDKGLRVALESTLYPNNCFLTLTYSTPNLPLTKSKNLSLPTLDYDAPVLFMKRLRERYGSGIRSFGCAEYGERYSRPHYHICLLNFDFPDKKKFKRSMANFGKQQRENWIYTSEELQSLWTVGHSSIGALTLESASYVARYCTKKITGKKALHHYELASDVETGEILTINPEKSIALSRGREHRGLGYPWYQRYGQYVRDHDQIVHQGKTYPVPKYFDKLTQEIDPDRFEEIKQKRRLAGQRATDALNQESYKLQQLNPRTEHRLFTLERCKELSFQLLKRGLENGKNDGLLDL